MNNGWIVFFQCSIILLEQSYYGWSTEQYDISITFLRHHIHELQTFFKMVRFCCSPGSSTFLCNYNMWTVYGNF